MNEIVKYNNKLNTIVFKNFTDKDLKVMFAIFAKMRDHGTEPVTFSFAQLRRLTEEKKHYTSKEYAEMMDEVYAKMIRTSYVYNDGVDVAGEVNLFEGYERSISEEIFTISVTPRFQYMFNSLTSEFTRLELSEFVNLRGKFTKLLYRQLKQWRSIGHYSVSMKELRELLDVPEGYETRDITKRVINPSVNKLINSIPEFVNLRYKYSYKGKQVVRVIFDWTPETIPHKAVEVKKDLEQETDDLIREIQERLSSL